jgi:erythromycin 3''-O-methyltransferase
MAITKRPSVWQDVVTLGRAARLAVSPPESRARRLYELFPVGNQMTEQTSYINMGYWRSPEDTLDDAGRALAELLADAAGLQPGDQVLDAGFGYGDQDFLWLRRHSLGNIIGLNVTPAHVRAAQAKARAQRLGERLDFRTGSATAMDLPAESIDRVVALESAFHFLPREEFFRQAYRVLRPEGVLATADIVPLDLEGAKGKGPFATAYPDDNWYGGDTYLAKLRTCGFVDVELKSIRDNVFDPWIAHLTRTVDDPAFRARVSRLYHSWLRREVSDQARMRQGVDGLDYVIVTARKPR